MAAPPLGQGKLVSFVRLLCVTCHVRLVGLEFRVYRV